MTKRQAKEIACELTAHRIHTDLIGSSAYWITNLHSEKDISTIEAALDELSQELFRRGKGAIEKVSPEAYE